MPNIKSAKKRVKVAAAKTAANKIVKSALRTSLKKAEAGHSQEEYSFKKEVFIGSQAQRFCIIQGK